MLDGNNGDFRETRNCVFHGITLWILGSGAVAFEGLVFSAENSLLNDPALRLSHWP